MRLFELHDISKHFGAIQALTEVNLKIDAGEVVGLMGDNGAGKSTLVKIIAGNFPAVRRARSRLKDETVAFPQAGRCAQPRASRSSIRTWPCATT